MSTGNIDIKVNTTSDGKGIKEAKKDIAGLTAEAEKLGKGGVLGALTSGVGKFALALGGITAAVAAAKRAFSEYAEAQQNVFQLDQALRAHGNLTDSIRQKYQELAGELSQLTAIADDEWLQTIARLTQFGVKPEQMEETIAFVKNLAGVMGGDLRGATEASVRALGGNYQAFTRLGITVDESATRLEKWADVAKRVAEMGGGQLEAGASGAAGEVKRLDNSVGELFESMGGLIVASGVLKVPIAALTGVANFLSGSFGGVIDKAEGMDNLFQRSAMSAQDAADSVAAYTKRLKELEEQSAKTTKTLSAEHKAQQLIKDLIDAQAKAELKRDLATVNAWVKEKRMSPERGAQVTEALENKADEEQFQRDQNFKRLQIRNIEGQIKNEDAGIANAQAEVTKAEKALKNDNAVQAAFDQATAPQRSVLDELQKKKTAIAAFPFSTASLVETQRIEEEIKKAQEVLARVATEFKAGDPGIHPLVQQLNIARSNLEGVKKSRTANKMVFEEEVGQSRMQMDAATGVRKVERQTNIIENNGSWAAGAGASKGMLEGVARDTVSAFQQYSRESATSMKELRQAFLEALQEVRTLKNDHNTLKQQVRALRN